MDGGRDYMTEFVKKERTVSFEGFEICENRIHATFYFYRCLGLTQQKFMKLLMGGEKQFLLLEWNENEGRRPQICRKWSGRAMEENPPIIGDDELIRFLIRNWIKTNKEKPLIGAFLFLNILFWFNIYILNDTANNEFCKANSGTEAWLVNLQCCKLYNIVLPLIGQQ